MASTFAALEVVRRRWRLKATGQNVRVAIRSACRALSDFPNFPESCLLLEGGLLVGSLFCPCDTNSQFFDFFLTSK